MTRTLDDALNCRHDFKKTGHRDIREVPDICAGCAAEIRTHVARLREAAQKMVWLMECDATVREDAGLDKWTQRDEFTATLREALAGSGERPAQWGKVHACVVMECNNDAMYCAPHSALKLSLSTWLTPLGLGMTGNREE